MNFMPCQTRSVIALACSCALPAAALGQMLLADRDSRPDTRLAYRCDSVEIRLNWTMRVEPSRRLRPVAAWSTDGVVRALAQLEPTGRASDSALDHDLVALRLEEGKVVDSSTVMRGRFTETYNPAALSWPASMAIPRAAFFPVTGAGAVRRLVSNSMPTPDPVELDRRLSFGPSAFAPVAEGEAAPLRVAVGRATPRRTSIAIVTPGDGLDVSAGVVDVPLKFASATGTSGRPLLAGLVTFRGESRLLDAIEFHQLQRVDSGWTSMRSQRFALGAQHSLSTPLIRAQGETLLIGWVETSQEDGSLFRAVRSVDGGATWEPVLRLPIAAEPFDVELSSPRAGEIVALAPWHPTTGPRMLVSVDASGRSVRAQLRTAPGETDVATIVFSDPKLGLGLLRWMVADGAENTSERLTSHTIHPRCARD